MEKMLNENQMIIAILGVLSVISLIIGQPQIADTSITLLGGYLGGIGIQAYTESKSKKL